MSGKDEIFTVFRISVVLFVLPAWMLATGFFIWERMYLYAALMVFFASLAGYGVYRNFDRLLREDKLDDERMKRINWKSGSSAFWTMLNTSLILTIFPELFTSVLKIGRSSFNRYSLTAVVAVGFISYFAFRAYYLRYGLENEFWRFE